MKNRVSNFCFIFVSNIIPSFFDMFQYKVTIFRQKSTLTLRAGFDSSHGRRFVLGKLRLTQRIRSYFSGVSVAGLRLAITPLIPTFGMSGFLPPYDMHRNKFLYYLYKYGRQLIFHITDVIRSLIRRLFFFNLRSCF